MNISELDTSKGYINKPTHKTSIVLNDIEKEYLEKISNHLKISKSIALRRAFCLNILLQYEMQKAGPNSTIAIVQENGNVINEFTWNSEIGSISGDHGIYLDFDQQTK